MSACCNAWLMALLSCCISAGEWQNDVHAVGVPMLGADGEQVMAFNCGATPQDLLSILQAMKAAGSLRAELEII